MSGDEEIALLESWYLHFTKKAAEVLTDEESLHTFNDWSPVEYFYITRHISVNFFSYASGSYRIRAGFGRRFELCGPHDRWKK